MKWVALMIFLLILSCEVEPKSFENRIFNNNTIESIGTITLNAHAKSLLPEVVKYPSRLHFYADHLFVSDRQGPFVLHILSLDSMSAIKSIINRGEGANELTGIWSMSTSASGKLLITETNTRELRLYNRSLLNGNVDDFSVLYNNHKKRIESPIIIENSIFYSRSGEALCYQSSLDFTNEESHGELPRIYSIPVPLTNYSQFCDNSMTKLGDNIVIAYRWLPIIDIFNSQSKKINSLYYPDLSLPIFNIKEDKINYVIGSTISRITDMAASNQYAYLLYSGNVFDPRLGAATEGNTILRINLNGEIDSVYNLDYNLSRIAITNDQQLFGYNHNDEPRYIYHYRF